MAEPYGFPDSLTPLSDRFIRDAQQQQTERILALAKDIGVERDRVHRALVQQGLWLCPVRPEVAL